MHFYSLVPKLFLRKNAICWAGRTSVRASRMTGVRRPRYNGPTNQVAHFSGDQNSRRPPKTISHNRYGVTSCADDIWKAYFPKAMSMGTGDSKCLTLDQPSGRHRGRGRKVQNKRNLFIISSSFLRQRQSGFNKRRLKIRNVHTPSLDRNKELSVSFKGLMTSDSSRQSQQKPNTY